MRSTCWICGGSTPTRCSSWRPRCTPWPLPPSSARRPVSRDATPRWPPPPRRARPLPFLPGTQTVTSRLLVPFCSPRRPSVSRWRRKVGSPSIEAAFEICVENILRDFVVDLWYSDITPDREVPELIRVLILHALGELSIRAKEMNLVDLLTRGTLSSEEIDDRLKQHIIVSQGSFIQKCYLQSMSTRRSSTNCWGCYDTGFETPGCSEPTCALYLQGTDDLPSLAQPVMNFASPMCSPGSRVADRIAIGDRPDKKPSTGHASRRFVNQRASRGWTQLSEVARHLRMNLIRRCDPREDIKDVQDPCLR